MEITFWQVSKFIWSHLRKHPVWLTSVFTLLILGTAMEIMMPYLFGMFADFLATNSENPAAAINGAFKILILIAITGITFWTASRSKNILWDWKWLSILKNIQQNAFFRVQRFSTEWHANSFAGATVRKITRGVWAANSFSQQFLTGFIPLSILIFGMIIAMFIRWQLIGIILASGTIFYTFTSVWLTAKFVSSRSRQAAKTDTKVGAILADSISCNSTVKIFGREKSEDKIFERTVEKWKKATWNLWLTFNCIDFAQAIIMTALKFGLLVPVVIFWAKGLASVGDAVFILASYNLVSSHLRGIGERIRETQKSANEMEDIVEFSLMPFLVADKGKARELEISKGKIEFKKISFKYSNQKKSIFKNFSVKITAGEHIALVGHSGSGKTTFVKLLQRLYNLKSGEIEIDGQNIAEITQKSLRRAIGLVPQEPLLFHRTLADNISYSQPRASFTEIEKVAQLAHATKFIEKLPKKYNTLVGERGIKLSGGERQRIAIARAMLADTPILILDEATSSLDSANEKLISDALKKLMHHRTTIVIAHRLSTIKSADRILVFANGKIVEEGRHAKLVRKKNGAYRKFYELQTDGFIGE